MINNPPCQCRRRKRHRFNPWVRKMPWRRKWQPTPALLPGKFHRDRSFVGYKLWGYKESDTTECAHAHTHTHTHTSLHIVTDLGLHPDSISY